VLGILKAGGAYLPLDPSYPRERLAFMLDDARVSVFVTQPQLVDGLPVDAAQGVCLGLDSSVQAEGGELAGHEGDDLPRQSGPENLAYVIYTSGSTGRPKGVELAHSGLCNLATAQAGAFGVEPGDRVLQLASLSFDASIWELTMALTRGAALHLVRQETLLSAEDLASAIKVQGITIVTFPPSLLGALPDDRLTGTLRTVVVAGEACSYELAARWAPGRRLFNAYGPSESTVCATIHRCDERDPSPPPIGRPIANTRLYVLDGGMRPLPVGVAGELYVGGLGLARGYRRRPALTAERFVPDPFGGEPGSRLYRTGDRVRYRADGSIEFLGRLDHQVKVRGFRVELGEIEAALARHEAIHEVVVVAREDQPGDRRLVAYYVAAGEVAGSELRAFLRQRLPEYMVPGVFVPLPAMPLSPNGKVDRKALPAPDRAALEVACVSPRDTTELILWNVWREILGSSEFGVTDSFFDLGGHSVDVIRLIGRVQQSFGMQLPMKSVMTNPTVETLAAALRKPNGASRSAAVPIQPFGSRTPLFLVHGAGGTVVGYHDVARHLGRERPVYGLQAIGIDDSLEPIEDLQIMAARYVQAVREVQPEEPYLLAGWSAGGHVAFEMANQLAAGGHRIGFVGLLDSNALQLGSRAPPRSDLVLLALLLQEELGIAAEPELEQLPPGQQLERALELARERGLLSESFTLEQARRILNVNRATERAVTNFVPRRYRGDVTLIRSASPLASSPSDGEIGDRSLAAPEDYGWNRFVEGAVRVLETPGNHQTMIREPHCRELARLIKECLADF
jgi:amino acid adenylation domain-containing protein